MTANLVGGVVSARVLTLYQLSPDTYTPTHTHITARLHWQLLVVEILCRKTVVPESCRRLCRVAVLAAPTQMPAASHVADTHICTRLQL